MTVNMRLFVKNEGANLQKCIQVKYKAHSETEEATHFRKSSGHATKTGVLVVVHLTNYP